MVAAAGTEVLAIVQARGGSKSILHKNARLLGGHPLIAYSIAAGQQSHSVTRLIVSTDDPELAAIGKEYGAEVPFMRPKELAQDTTPDLPLFQHAIEWLRQAEGYVPDLVVQLRPTSPLRPAELVDQAVETLLANPKADSVRGITTANQTPYKMWNIQKNGFLKPLLERLGQKPYNMPRQLVPQVFWQTGHVDVMRRETLEQYHSLTGRHVLPFLIDRWYCVDIDTELDWEHAEWLLSHGRLSVVRPAVQKAGLEGHSQRCLPAYCSLLVLDFDGVLTDNRVWMTEQGLESVSFNRSDGLGIELLQRRGTEIFVLSKERSPVVAARCRKLGIQHQQGVEDKQNALQSLVMERGINVDHVVYVGNDINDLPCMASAGCGVAVADAHPEVLKRADLVLKHPGGMGAVRELCDLMTAGDQGLGRNSKCAGR
jgi:N-acylneuraminate cytidylyltransferase